MRKVVFVASLLVLLALVSCGKTHTQATSGGSVSSVGQSASPAPYLAPTNVPPTSVPPTSVPPTQAPPTAVPTNPPLATMHTVLAKLSQALKSHDALALSRLMSKQVMISGCCTDGGVKYANTSVAQALVEGSYGKIECWAYGERLGRSSLVLLGFQFPSNGTLPNFFRPPVKGVEFIFAESQPYWITTLVLLWMPKNELRSFGFRWGCESPADQFFPVAEQASAGNTLSGDCWNAPAPRLQVGEYAYVSLNPPMPNRIRSAPSRNGKVLGWAQPGRKMKVLDGPVCGDGWAWWRVQLVNSNMTGWTAEGDGDEYWLVPCHALADCP